MSTITAPRPVAAIKDDIRRYGERLRLDTVRASSHWYEETKAKLHAAEAELASAARRDRVAADRAKAAADMAWLDAVQDIAPHVAGAGAR
ncbi:hypothetical protein [Streptacidiphilus cavernicola]|uniref:Uncharacterized protein n=1 Tax=Streptacidiphilus cavernicola TaxID=3342716 RepID=A0ABV6W4G2_9ACTN